MNESDIIPEEKIKEAVAKCMANPKYADYFNGAPPAAKEYIALQFYCTVFSADVTDEQRELYMGEVEEDLSIDDVHYLLAHESDPGMRERLNQLLSALKKAIAEEDPVVAVPAAATVAKPVSAPRMPMASPAANARSTPDAVFDSECALSRTWQKAGLGDIWSRDFWEFKSMITPGLLKGGFKLVSALLLVVWVLGIALFGYGTFSTISKFTMLTVLQGIFLVLLEVVGSALVLWLVFLVIRVFFEWQLILFTIAELLREIRNKRT